MWWNICHSIVVIKYCFINCWNEIWNEDLHLMKCLNNLLDRFSKIIWCDEDVLKNCFIELFHRIVEDVLKMCWRCVEELLKICIIICIKLVMSVWTLLDRFSKIIRWRCEVLFSIFEYSWNEVMNNPSLNMLWWSKSIV